MENQASKNVHSLSAQKLKNTIEAKIGIGAEALVCGLKRRETMKSKVLGVILGMMFVVAGMGYAADDQTSSGTQAAPQSLGGQAGEAARELKGTADESLSTGTRKVAESSKKVQAEAQETLKTLQQQWDALAKQLQEKTQQIQKQLQEQWQDFNKSYNKPKP